MYHIPVKHSYNKNRDNCFFIVLECTAGFPVCCGKYESGQNYENFKQSSNAYRQYATDGRNL